MIELDNGFVKIENSDLFNISHFNTNAEAASAVATQVTTKVDKVTGKGLSTEDYTSAEKTKLAGIAEGANNYSLPTASSSTLGGVKVGDGLAINNGVLSANGYALPTASASTKGGIKISESSLGTPFSINDDVLELNACMGLGGSGDCFISSVALNGTTISADDYDISTPYYAIGGKQLLPCIGVWSVTFYFQDERTIASGSTLTFNVGGNAFRPGSTVGVVVGSADGSTFEDCGRVYSGGFSGAEAITVKLTSAVKYLYFKDSGSCFWAPSTT